MTVSLVSLLDAAGLTGRGGAGFSTAAKVRAAASEDASLIVNACDGEYGAVKDGFVVEHHLDDLVQGANLLARAKIRYAARGSRSESLLRSAGLDVLSAPHRYVSSEESAQVLLANGGLARPMTKRVPVVFARPTRPGARCRRPWCSTRRRSGGSRRSPTEARAGSGRSGRWTSRGRALRRCRAPSRPQAWSRPKPAWVGELVASGVGRSGRSAVSGSAA
ncbi:MAG: hypothetical protein ABJA74_16270 [Lapillicoccus sp.]